MQDAQIAEPEIGRDARAGRRDISRPEPRDHRRAGNPGDKLTTAKRDLPRLSCGCRNHRQLQRWLRHALPQNIGDEAAQRRAATLRSLLSEIARWQAKASQRLACLEVLRPAVIELGQSLGLAQLPQYGGAQTREAHRSVQIACILHQHLAQAFSSVCAELANDRDTPFARRHLRLALHRASDSLRRLIYISSQFHLATPKHTWIRLQLLLKLARERGLSRHRVFDPFARKQPSANVLGIERLNTPYLHCALFASTNPLQFSSTEQQDLWRLCGRWAKDATILDQHCPGSRALLANIKLDQAPIPSMRLQNAGVEPRHFSIPQGWTVDLGRPLRHLQLRMQRPADIALDVLQRVHNLWGGDLSRDGRRTPVNVRCEVVIGITAICHHLNRSAAAPPEVGATFGSPARETQRLVMDVGAVDFRTGDSLAEYEVALPSAPTTRRDHEHRDQGRYRSIPCTLLNTSPNGAGLRLPPGVHGKLRSGDLIGIAMSGRWEVAVVRWQYALPDQCRAGVELLGGHTSAVRVHRHTRDGRRTDPIAALLTGDCGRAPELILPTPLFQPGDSVDVVAAGQARCVTLHQRTLGTGSFAIFDFS
ncbi:hypothetical protein ACNKU7_00930 [Microbulbifer sp. SA54]|uniref:hypothetical protein n=1 Tax=Microbulbifer sp. SA54 TaxID=3401577 RepID=UPI003AAC362E